MLGISVFYRLQVPDFWYQTRTINRG